MNKSNRKVAVIGLGAIGKNHFRALLRLSVPTDFYLVDPMFDDTSQQALRDEAVHHQEHTVVFHHSVDKLPKQIDLAVVATKSDIRLDVLEKLLGASRVEYLILEKVLFQDLAHYSQAEALLGESGTTCWVHHTRRAYPFYCDLQKAMRDDRDIHVEVTGGMWGLACNGLHFLDLFQFLIGTESFVIDMSGLEPKIVPSKREGFKEVLGTVRAQSPKNHRFSMTSLEFDFPLEIKIYSRERSLQIDESKQWVRYRDSTNRWQPEIKEAPVVHYISEFTHRIAEAIFKSGSCDLPSYREASGLHQRYLKSLMEHFTAVEQRPCLICPIT